MKKRIRVKAYIVFMMIIAMLLALLVVAVEAKEPGIPGVKFGEMAQERPFDGIIGDEDGFIKHAPTVVELTRCKDCKFRENDDFCTGRGFPYQLVPDDGYCDKGKEGVRT